MCMCVDSIIILFNPDMFIYIQKKLHSFGTCTCMYVVNKCTRMYTHVSSNQSGGTDTSLVGERVWDVCYQISYYKYHYSYY